ncbi:MAG: hypothetical protein ACRDTX_23455 [Pseudonocardiaceae bacterium]
MLFELMLAAMQGVSTALADRFIQGRESSATIRSIVGDVAAIKELQAQDRASIIEFKHLLTRVLERADGLEVHHRKVVFVATTQTPDVESALMNLDLEISRLRLGAHDSAHRPGDRTPAVDTRTRAADPSSIFYQLDEEIAELRRGPGDGR